MKVLATALMASTALAAAAHAQGAPATAPTSLESGFQNPPNSARPRVWWHWMNGNITKDGIRKDIEWMSRVGIGGLQNFDAQLMTPQVVEHRLAYMTPEWKDAFRYAAQQADQHGLELAIASSPGWSETGGPWVEPKDAMKKLVWSETVVEGGKRFDGALAPVPEVTGPYQDMPMAGGMDALMGGKKPPPPTYSGAVAVLAWRLPQGRDLPAPKLTSGDGQALDANVLAGGDLKSVVQVNRGADETASIVADYGQAQTVRSATVYVPSAEAIFGGPALEATLEVLDGADWRKVTDVPLSNVPTTVSFAPVTAAKFRLVMKPPAKPTLMSSFLNAAPGVAFSIPLPPAPKTIRVTELRLSGEARVNAAELKAGYAIAPDYYALDADAGPDVAGVAPADVVDLTGKLKSDGTLDWTPPAGRWKVLRLGYSLLGTTNHPATAEATGLEVDKYDGDAVHRYLEHYIATYADTTGPDLIGQKGLKAFLTDSTEVGPSNWTPQMIAQFKALRGYDPTPWLPALTGVVVGSRKQSDAFLYDFRRTLADLHASQHYGTVAAVAHEHGLKVYGEALEDHRPVLGDDMAMRRFTDVPMSALWTYKAAAGPKFTYLADMKGAASVAHIYGQNLVAAESLTASMSPWAYAPHDLKAFMDLELVTGINRPVIHTSVHQPLDKPPGLSLFIFGQYFNRLDSWAELAKPWVDYMARSSYLLQQGRNVADVGYFYGEEAPLTSLYGDTPVADAPVRYAYDFVGADALLNQLKVDGGELTTAGGARYRALYLGGSSRKMTLPALKRIAALADAGGTVVGTAPQGSPSLKDDPAQYQALVHKLWSGQPVTQVGKGRVYASHDIEAALTAAGVAPDFAYSGGAADADVRFLHRRLAGGDIYFINNRKDRAEKLEARFRVSGKAPQIWRADTGQAEPVSYRIEGGETVVPLDLLPQDAVFVVFRNAAKAQALTVPVKTWTQVAQVAGPWTVDFQPGRAAPAQAKFDKLQSLTESADPGIKYFSGIATYRQTFTAPRGVKPGAPVMLDLGQVGDIAQVFVNGQEVGYAWKAPWRVDVTRAIRPGKNRLEVRVADKWVNRLVGDAQPGAKKITYTTLPTYKADAPLQPSGLIGPVVLLAQ